jgi:hypothetical protein
MSFEYEMMLFQNLLTEDRQESHFNEEKTSQLVEGYRLVVG